MSDSNTAHAKLSASQTKRWMTCPGSVRIIDDLTSILKPKQSEYAALGTAAHALAENCLKTRMLDAGKFVGAWINLKGEMQYKIPNPIDISKKLWFEIDIDMATAINVYLQVVKGEMDRLGEGAELGVENRFDLSWVRPDMFGTNDAYVSQFLEELVIIDYKHGQGVPVEITSEDEEGNIRGNSQLMYYLLGAAYSFDFTHETYTIIVVQPRCPHPNGVVRKYSCGIDELMLFKEQLEKAADTVNEASVDYDNIKSSKERRKWEDKNLIPGDHCRTAFCPAMATCPSLYRLAEKQAQIDFMEEPDILKLAPLPIGIDALSRALKWVPILDARNRSIEQTSKRLAEQGIKIPGYKLVNKRSIRYWAKPDEEVKKALINVGLVPDQFLTPVKLLSPSKIEALSIEAFELVNGRKLSNDTNWITEPLCEKKDNGTTLVKESDPRAEIVLNIGSEFPDFDG